MNVCDCRWVSQMFLDLVRLGPHRFLSVTKSGLYRQCTGTGKSGAAAKRVRRCTVDTACCT
jgi:hypothetical protein